MINKEAVLHIPLSQYAYASDENSLTIRLRAAKGNLICCTLYFGDRAHPTDPIPFLPIKMQAIAHDQLFDYFEVSFKPNLTRICYYFKLNSKYEECYYCSDLFIHELPAVRSEFYQYPFIRREEIRQVPAWFKEAAVYNFATKKEHITKKGLSVELPGGIKLRTLLGGTINGITENLDYIKSMGLNCIYLNPVFTANDYHKYDLVDYFNVDPCFGTNDDFSRLVDTCHSKDMRVIIDGVFNHCGLHFFAFKDVVENGKNSKYWNWFYSLEEPVIIPEMGKGVPNYQCFAYEPKMPKLNTSNPETRDYFMKVCKHWTKNYHIDGWRLDVANEVDREFWRAFRRCAKGINPECVLIAEIWESAESWLNGDMFDSTMNYDFRRHCRDFFALGKIDAAEFDARATIMRMRYPTGIVESQLNLLDSHDVSRFLSLCDGDIRKLMLAVLFLMTFPGVPSVFYGDELKIQGFEEHEYRQAMPWENEKSELVEFYKQAISLRNNPAVISGSFNTLRARKGEMIYMIERQYKGHCLLLLLNAGSEPVEKPNNTPNSQPLFSFGCNEKFISGFGYAIWSE